MPVSPRLQERLAGFESLTRPIGGELNGQCPFKYVKVRLNWMHHPWRDRSRSYGQDARGDYWIRVGRILKWLTYDRFDICGNISNI